MSTAYPQWLPDPQGYEVEQERYRHDQAMNLYGEYAIFVLLWRIWDHEAGLVDRCPECFTAYGKIAEVYKQPAKRECVSCFGTTFEGGIKAKIVRTSLWDVTEEDEHTGQRGEEKAQSAAVQSTSDFRLRHGDYVFRADGTRWKMRTVSTNRVRSGFQMPEGRAEIGFNYGQVQREDESSVAFLIPPSTDELIDIADRFGVRYPPDFTAYEEINGPLLP